MPGPIVQETSGETTARQSAATTLETTVATLLSNITSYNAAGSGKSQFSVDAAKRYIVYRLQVAGMNVTDADRGGFTLNQLLSQMILNKES